MAGLKATLLRSILLIFPLLFLTSCGPISDSSFREANAIYYGDIVFYPGKNIKIPLSVRQESVSGVFKIKENIVQLADRLESIVSPQIIIREENEKYLIIEVHDEGLISNAIVFGGNSESVDGEHYYVIDGLYRGIGSAEAKYTGYIYWPRQYFPLENVSVLLVSGEKYETRATIDDFEAFYQNVSEQQGISFERKGNTIILPKEFLCGNQELRAVLTFEEGTVKVDLME